MRYQHTVPHHRLVASYIPRVRFFKKQSYSYRVDIIYSDDYFSTKRLALPRGNSFSIINGFIFASQLLDQANQEIALFQARLENKYLFLIQTQIYPSALKDHGYNFIPSVGKAVLHANHTSHNALFGNLYTSNFFFNSFNLALHYVIRDKYGEVSFHEVDGLTGIFLANVINKEYYEKNQDEVLQGEYEGNAEITKRLMNYCETLISYNGGSKWNPLEIKGKRIHIDTLKKNSNHSAVGYIIGSGTEGEFIGKGSEYLFGSTDNGKSWSKVQP